MSQNLYNLLRYKKEEEKEMKQTKLITFLFFLFSIYTVNAQQTKSALFIGNSYTAANNLPSLVSSMATSVGHSLIHSAQTPGGAQLNQHISNSTVINSISGGKWNFVVLQEQSQKPSFSPSYVASNVFPFAKRLCDTIRMFDSCTQPVFFMTWGRKFGDAGNCPSSPWLCTYEGMDSALAKSYNTMGTQNNAFVSPVGAVWKYIRNNDTTINLYTSDNSHPNINGSYAAACMFFTVFYRTDPRLISFNSTVNATTASFIRNAVKTVVYDSLSKWNVGNFDPVSAFTYQVFGNTLQFTNNSSLADNYTWDFSDGNVIGTENPSHTYLSNGTYTVSLIASKCGLSDTSYQTITVGTTNLEENESKKIEIYPNPSSSGMFRIINGNGQDFRVFSSHNKCVRTMTTKHENHEIDLSDLPSGIYFLVFESGKVEKLIIE